MRNFIIGLFLGGATGAGITYLIMKKQAEAHEEVLRKEIREECKKYYEKKEIDELDAMANHEKAIPDKPVENKEYNDLVKEYDPSEEESPEDDDPMTEEEARIVSDDLVQQALEAKNEKPKIITADSFGEIPHYEYETLKYYVHDHTLVHEDESIVDDPAFLVGDAIDRYGWGDNDEEEGDLYVRNYRLQRDYEIVKIFDEYPAD